MPSPIIRIFSSGHALIGGIHWSASTLEIFEQTGMGRIYLMCDGRCEGSGFDGILVDSDNDGVFDRSATNCSFNDASGKIMEWKKIVWPE